jgi:hypothetical protein
MKRNAASGLFTKPSLDEPQIRPSPLRLFFRADLVLTEDLFVKDVILGADGIDDKKNDDRFFPILRGFEMLHPILVFPPEGGEGCLIEAEDSFGKSVQGGFEHFIIAPAGVFAATVTGFERKVK